MYKKINFIYTKAFEDGMVGERPQKQEKLTDNVPSYALFGLVFVFLLFMYLLAASPNGEAISGAFVSKIHAQPLGSQKCTQYTDGAAKGFELFSDYCVDDDKMTKRQSSNYLKSFSCAGNEIKETLTECFCEFNKCISFAVCSEDVVGNIIYKKDGEFLTQRDRCSSSAHLVDVHCREGQPVQKTRICSLGCIEEEDSAFCMTHEKSSGRKERVMPRVDTSIRIRPERKITTFYPEEEKPKQTYIGRPMVTVDMGELSPAVLEVDQGTKILWKNIDFTHYSLHFPGEADFKQNNGVRKYVVSLTLPKKSSNVYYTFKNKGTFPYQLKKNVKGMMTFVGEGTIVVR